MIKYVFAAILFWSVFSPPAALAINPADLIKLKEAGVSNQIIHAVIESNAIDRAIISVDEIVAMKAAKIPDKAILRIIQDANQPVPELDSQDAGDFSLRRELKRAEMKLELQKKELEIAREHLSRLITHPEILNLVKTGKLSSEDYAAIVKYLKQYARDEDSVDYREDKNIQVDIEKTYPPQVKHRHRKAIRPSTEERVVDGAIRGLRIRKDID
ncbi:MAG: hypothetical protein DRH10_06055 [Deltaproteobacteria bacterium]|nr:MAG: hypothetical protein DRH10_06055 [Deltaproteobacteria bacterium]